MVANRTDARFGKPKITKTKAIITGEFSRSSQTMARLLMRNSRC